MFPDRNGSELAVEGFDCLDGAVLSKSEGDRFLYKTHEQGFDRSPATQVEYDTAQVRAKETYF